MTTTLWQQNNGSLKQTPLQGPLFLNGEFSEQPQDDALVVAPVRNAGEAAAAALVPAKLAREVSHNGVPVPVGLFLLQHADRVDFKANRFWISVAAQAEHAEYTLDQHGQDVFCFITKARLKQGEPITICPGTPEKTCGMIYNRTAWQMAIEASSFKCPNCQFDPHRPVWQPPQEKPPTMLDDLFRILSQEPAP